MLGLGIDHRYAFIPGHLVVVALHGWSNFASMWTGWNREVPCGPINNYEQVFADPHVIAREMAVDVEHPTLGRMKSLGSAIKLSDTLTNARRRAPMRGEHTDVVLKEYGFSAEEIASLRAAGAVA